MSGRIFCRHFGSIGHCPLVAGALFAAFLTLLLIGTTGCHFRQERFARDRFGTITREACQAVLDNPAAWSVELADAVGLDDTATEPGEALAAAARYISAARALTELATPETCSVTVEMTLARAKEDFLLQMVEEEIISSVTDVGPDAIRAYYYDHLSDYTHPTRRRFAQIFVRAGLLPDGRWRSREQARTMALSARSAIADGSPFSEVAAAVSETIGGPPDGVIGPVPRGAVRSEVDDVLWTLQPGEVSGTVESGSGTHLLYLLDEQPEEIEPLDMVEDDIANTLFTDRIEEEKQRFLQRVAQPLRLDYRPERADPSMPATAVVLRLGGEIYTRARCEAWIAELPAPEREIYIDEDRRATYIRERCERMILLAVARHQGYDTSEAFQERWQQQVEALRLTTLLQEHVARVSATNPAMSARACVAALLRQSRFRGPRR